ncbi:hypothetical protein IWW56_000201 [Coemansia sp. RSA 2131]|nr:hypothetical protein IWW56_000201 [Coemansia sp. RSA 2131]
MNGNISRIEELKRSVPVASVLQCRLLRAVLENKRTALDLFEEGREGLVNGVGDRLGPWLMRAVRNRSMVGHLYTMHNPPSRNDVRNGRTYGEAVGRVASNTMGTKYTISERSDANKWQDVCVVTYDINFMGKQGPRKMTAIIRAVDEHGCVVEPLQPLSLVRHKQPNAHIVGLESKCPRWNSETGSFGLEFFNRVLVSSVKNFQLVSPHDVDYVVVQFGKVADDVFTMDARFPMTPIMAFGIAVSSMDHKLACP